MRILAAEPYAASSHLLFLEGLAEHSRHELEIVSLPARTWKWRMRTASIHFAEVIKRDGPFDLLFASDFLNLAETLALLPAAERAIPTALYFHENQLTYPLQAGEQRDVHHALTHIHSILAADCTLFNSHYHLESFIAAAAKLLDKVPDVDVSSVVSTLRDKSSMMPLGLDLKAGTPAPPTKVPTILWPHRWEYDKDPGASLRTLIELDQQQIEFRLRLAGQRFRTEPPELNEIKTRFADRIEPDEFLDREAHLRSLASCEIVISTAQHEFFGLGTLEAIRSGAFPVLPRDLAYPELLPQNERNENRFLYDRDVTPTACLARAIKSVQNGEWMDERRELVKYTDRFAWSQLASQFDEQFERLAPKRATPDASVNPV